MNTPKSVMAGWVVFTVAGVGGSYIGYKQWQNGQEARRQANVERAEMQRIEVKRINEKLARERAEKLERQKKGAEEAAAAAAASSAALAASASAPPKVAAAGIGGATPDPSRPAGSG